MTAAEGRNLLKTLADSVFFVDGGFGSLSEDDIIDQVNDYLIYYDASSGTQKRSMISNILRMVKAPVKAAATGNINLSTEVEAGDTLDGVVLAAGDRILAPYQTTALQNGIYIVQASGTAVRANDMDNSYNTLSGCVVYVQQGTVNAKKTFTLTAPTGTITVGTDNLTFEELAGIDVLDEDDMASNSATAVPSQQSVKAYVDNSSTPRMVNAKWDLNLPSETFDIDGEGAYSIALFSDSETGTLSFKYRIKGNVWDDNSGSYYTLAQTNTWLALRSSDEWEIGCFPNTPDFDPDNDSINELVSVGCLLEFTKL